MEKIALAIDLGTSYLKSVAFLLEKRGIKVLNFTKVVYTPDLIDDFEEKIKEMILGIKGRYDFNLAVIGSGEGIGKGSINRSVFLRRSYLSPITKNELKEITRDAQRKSFIKTEKEIGNKKFFLASAKIKNITIDGHQTFSPIGLTGKKLSLEIVNFYLPLKIYQSLKKSLFSLNIKELSFEYIPWILPNVLFDYAVEDKLPFRQIGSKTKFFIDVGGRNSQISIMEKGEIEKVMEVNFGGNHFIERIAAKLKIEPDQLFFERKENILEFKIKKDSITNESQQKIIQEVLEESNRVWREKIIVALENHEQKRSTIEIYLFGGGSNFLFLEEFKKEFAKKSFHCIIKKITPLDLKYIFNFNSSDPQATIPLLICKTLI